MDYTKLSIKHFIGDLPRIINENFETVKTLLNKFVTENTADDGSIIIKGNGTKSLNGEFGSVKANSVRANNIIIVEGNTTYTLKDYINKCISENSNINNGN